MAANDNETIFTARKRNRGKMDITADILTIATAPIGKTRIMYEANLSYAQVVYYLKELQEKNLIEETIDERAIKFRTTEKGREFIGHFCDISELLEKDFEASPIAMS